MCAAGLAFARTQIGLKPPPIAAVRISITVERRQDGRASLGGPVPALLYVAMVAAGIAGVVLGVLYATFVLDAPGAIVPVAFGFVLEAIVGSWFAGKKLGRPLTNDQRVRVAITYTLMVAGVVAPLFALGWMPGSRTLLDRLDGLSSGGVLAALGVSALGLATVALARYLVLSAVSPLVSPLRKPKEGAGAGGHA